MTEPAPQDRKAWQERKRRAARREAGRRRSRRLMALLAGFFRYLPRPVALLVGGGLGWLAWLLAGASRRVAADHLERALGHRYDAAERRRIVRRMFVQHGRSAAEILCLRRTGVGPVERFVESEGREHLDGALAAGRGVIALTPHYGNFELLAALLARSMKVRVVGRDARGGDAEEFLHAMRAGFGVETIPQGQPRQVLRTLRDGGMVGTLPDQDLCLQPGIFVSFFGMPAYTVTGPATLALATGAPLVPVCLRRLGGGRHRMIFLPPIVPDADAPDRDAEVRRLTEAWSRALESFIEGDPSQWVWFHRRWRTTPETLQEIRRAREAGKVVRVRPPKV